MKLKEKLALEYAKSISKNGVYQEYLKKAYAKAWDDALDWAVNNAEADVVFLDQQMNDRLEAGKDYEVFVLKGSILIGKEI